APIELRERFAQQTADVEAALQAVRRLDLIEEACILSTCNRVEFYVSGRAEPSSLARSLLGYIQSFSGMPPETLEPHLYRHEGAEAVHHLFRVSGSLDSMVLGEPQILGQVKDAYRTAVEHASAGPVIRKAFEKAFSVAKRVRTETGVAENAVSMSFAAVELGREIFDTLNGREVLLVGAGKMATLAAKHLAASGVQTVKVASRSLTTAQRLADEIGAQASSMNDVPMLMQSADIVICSTAAPTFVIDKAMMSKVVPKRRYRPILFVDIAVPRDVDPKVAELDNVFVYDVDDLEAVLEVNRENRAQEAAAADRLIRDELARYMRWSRSQQVGPVIKALRARAAKIAAEEAQRTLSGIKTPDKKTSRSINAMGNAIVNKILHPVLTQLKTEGAEGDPQVMLDALVALFDLELEDPHAPVAKDDPVVTNEADDATEPPAEVIKDDTNVVYFRRQDAGRGN
ncbi:MAG: glutamyl-tRNA reductase, partial [Myxococcota bacterium]